MSVKILTLDDAQTQYDARKFSAPWLTLSTCCQAKTHYGLGGHICDKCKKDCNTATVGDTLAALTKRQKDEVAEFSKRKDNDTMALKLVNVDERKMPRSKVGKFTALDDIKQAFAELSKLPPGKAIQIDLDNDILLQLKKDGTKDAARSIVNMLKRKFTNDGLPYKAYASDEKTITIIKAVDRKPKGK